ncbi:MAG: hypothetical protein JWQ95_1058, partial [Sphaerisporangium sp.]|nr:hypothetical protein [Sphaerisporangium sp.]
DATTSAEIQETVIAALADTAINHWRLQTCNPVTTHSTTDSTPGAFTGTSHDPVRYTEDTR